MQRTPLLRNTPLRAKTSLSRSGAKLQTHKQLGRVSTLVRTAMKRRARRAKPGDEPRYKAWIKTLPCCVGGQRCGRVDPHHLIDGKGDAKKGMSQTAPDRYLLPLCRRHHEQFHDPKDRRGFAFGWDPARRLTFQEQECERLRDIWRDLNDLEVLQEPLRQAI